MIDESDLTGESEPVHKMFENFIISGTMSWRAQGTLIQKKNVGLASRCQYLIGKNIKTNITAWRRNSLIDKTFKSCRLNRKIWQLCCFIHISSTLSIINFNNLKIKITFIYNIYFIKDFIILYDRNMCFSHGHSWR